MRLSLLLLLAALAALAACSDSGPTRPNVILITMDTVRADYVSCYGQPGGNAGGLTEGTTPALDRLASMGARFESAQSASAVTPVSHATILTGQFPYTHRLRVLSGEGGSQLDTEAPTLATRFKAAGYTTVAVHSAFPVSSVFGFSNGFDIFESMEGDMALDESKGKTTWDTQRFQRRSDETSDRVLGALAGIEEPYFLWIHYWDPHDPHLKPPLEALRGLEGLGKIQGTVSPEYADFYAREIAFQDSQIGRLLEELKVYDTNSNTVIAVTADHGEGLADGMRLHGWSKHRMTYREQLWVPLILAGPGVPSGTTVSAQVRTADVAPTLLDLAGLSTPAQDFDGISLRAHMDGSSQTPLIAYADQINAFDWNAGMVAQRPGSAFMYSVSDGDWKLIYRPHMVERSELFNLVQDPTEANNVIEQQPDVARRLLEDLAERRPWVTRSYGQPGDDGSAEALAGLGYAAGSSAAGLVWTWSCPGHPGSEHEDSGRCSKEGCDQRMIPRTTWE
ncbi:MAG: arylsulfatase A-like enzyme [Planctomycetota bacterium]|jgi:arylsulfatase A-like enzyme